MSRAEDCARVAGLWREAGMDPVTEVVWETTPHIQHFRLDPERYTRELDAFLDASKALELPGAARL